LQCYGKVAVLYLRADTRYQAKKQRFIGRILY
jgi:hypothetical protein